jgi:hypothetical protein
MRPCSPDRTRISTKLLVLVLLLLAGLLLSGVARQSKTASLQVFLWAWERPENLVEADPSRVGVAYLAETIKLTGREIVVERRRQPLRVAPGANTITVARIEASYERPPVLDSQQQSRVAEELAALADRNSSRELQIDFDATLSQRAFYRDVLSELRHRQPKVRLSMTALASWCLADPWIHGLPVDEAVPMLFRMGPDARYVRRVLNSGGDFQEPLCRQSYGLSLDEQAPSLPGGRRAYWFNPQPWSRDQIEKLAKR